MLISFGALGKGILIDGTLLFIDPTVLDPTTMSEENLKKSVMTIIFGKDVPDENVDANTVENREKSPDASSTSSSDSGREKRYGLRVVKPAKKGVVAPLPESKDHKILRIPLKSSSR